MIRRNTLVTPLKSTERKSYGIQITTFHYDNSIKDEFIIPVLDVRDGDEARKAAEKLEKAGNAVKGSKYIKPTFSWKGLSYNTSTKQK